jgi:ABC-type xylose transport system permease subunit
MDVMVTQTKGNSSATSQPYKESFSLRRFARTYGTQLGMLGVFFGLWIIFMVSAPDTFLSSRIYFAFMSTIPFFAIMAISLTMIVIAGDIHYGHGYGGFLLRI